MRPDPHHGRAAANLRGLNVPHLFLSLNLVRQLSWKILVENARRFKMEKVHEEKQELMQLETEKNHLVEEIKERERSFELMMKAKTSTESSLAESKERLKDLQIKNRTC